VGAPATDDGDADTAGSNAATAGEAADDEGEELAVYGDAAYGSGDTLERLEGLGADPKVKTPPPTSRNGHYTKDDFRVDLAAGTVICPAGAVAIISCRGDGSGTATFGAPCHTCPLRAQCTTAESGRTVKISRHEQRLTAQRARQRDPAWQAEYPANRPKVERKLSHLVRRWHGGRRARMGRRQRIAQDWQLLAAGHNLARMAVRGVHKTASG
jgi:hypothetical protein